MKIVRKEGPGAAVLKKALAGLSDVDGKVGWFPGAKYEDGTPVAQVAAENELGLHQRPFMRPTIIEKEKEWQGLAQSGAKAIIAGNETSETVMEKITLLAAGQIRKTISDITSPPLSPFTIAARLSKRADGKTIGSLTKPLIESALMLNTLTNTVEKK